MAQVRARHRLSRLRSSVGLSLVAASVSGPACHKSNAAQKCLAHVGLISLSTSTGKPTILNAVQGGDLKSLFLSFAGYGTRQVSTDLQPSAFTLGAIAHVLWSDVGSARARRLQVQEVVLRLWFG